MDTKYIECGSSTSLHTYTRNVYACEEFSFSLTGDWT